MVFVAEGEVSLFVFMLDLGTALSDGSSGDEMCALGYDVLLEGLSLPFVRLEYGTVKTTIVIKVIQL